jgi:hypothetical protein
LFSRGEVDVAPENDVFQVQGLGVIHASPAPVGARCAPVVHVGKPFRTRQTCDCRSFAKLAVRVNSQPLPTFLRFYRLALTAEDTEGAEEKQEAICTRVGTWLDNRRRRKVREHPTKCTSTSPSFFLRLSSAPSALSAVRAKF